MKATTWEFRNRALVIGLIFAAGFSAYQVDPQDLVTTAADWMGLRFGADPHVVTRVLFALAAFLLVISALIRTWASAYLQARVVYAPDVKSDALVTDGPYRYTRNPLYFANLPLAIGLSALLNWIGFSFVTLAMVVFSYRLIFREESELLANQGRPFDEYKRAVPRLWPALRPCIASSGRKPNWTQGVRAELWAWGYVIASIVFAVTLNIRAFFIILAISIGALALVSAVLRRHAPGAQSRDSSQRTD